MDTKVYPGDAKLSDWWANGPFWFTSFYLAPTLKHTDTSWMDKYSTITNMGWGLLPVYVGRQRDQTEYLNAEQGKKDAKDADGLGRKAGLPTGSYIYLDIEEGGRLEAGFISYIKAWALSLYNDYNYIPGIYCSHKDTADQIQNELGSDGPDVRYWIFNLTWSDIGNGAAPNPADCGVSYASTWQGKQKTYKTYGSSTIHIDGNSSIYEDPSS